MFYTIPVMSNLQTTHPIRLFEKKKKKPENSELDISVLNNLLTACINVEM